MYGVSKRIDSLPSGTIIVHGENEEFNTILILYDHYMDTSKKFDLTTTSKHKNPFINSRSI